MKIDDIIKDFHIHCYDESGEYRDNIHFVSEDNQIMIIPELKDLFIEEELISKIQKIMDKNNFFDNSQIEQMKTIFTIFCKTNNEENLILVSDLSEYISVNKNYNDIEFRLID